MKLLFTISVALSSVGVMGAYQCVNGKFASKINFCASYCNVANIWPNCGTNTFPGTDPLNTDNVDYTCSCSGCNNCPLEKCGKAPNPTNCVDTKGCQPLADPPTVYCEATKTCVAYQNDGANCKQEKTHPIPRCQDIYTEDDTSHPKEPWFFCAAGDQDRSLTGADDVGKCMPTESAHGKVCVNFLKWAFMQAVQESPGPNCFVNGLRSDKNCRVGIATSVAKTAWEVNVEIQGQTKTTSFLVRCADEQKYNPQPKMSAGEGKLSTTRPKECRKTFYLRLQDSRANNYNDEYLYCGDNEHNWRPTPFTGSPTSAPTVQATIKPVTPTPSPNNGGGGGEVICGEEMNGGYYCNEDGKVVKIHSCVTVWSAELGYCDCHQEETTQPQSCCSNCETKTVDSRLSEDLGECNLISEGGFCEPEVVYVPKECTEDYNRAEEDRTYRLDDSVQPPWSETECLNYDFDVGLRCGSGRKWVPLCEAAETAQVGEEELCQCYRWTGNPHGNTDGNTNCDTGNNFGVPDREDVTDCTATCWDNQVNNSGRPEDSVPLKPTKDVKQRVTCLNVDMIEVDVVNHELYVDETVPCNTRSCAFVYPGAANR